MLKNWAKKIPNYSQSHVRVRPNSCVFRPNLSLIHWLFKDFLQLIFLSLLFLVCFFFRRFAWRKLPSLVFSRTKQTLHMCSFSFLFSTWITFLTFPLSHSANWLSYESEVGNLTSNRSLQSKRFHIGLLFVKGVECSFMSWARKHDYDGCWFW